MEKKIVVPEGIGVKEPIPILCQCGRVKEPGCCFSPLTCPECKRDLIALRPELADYSDVQMERLSQGQNYPLNEYWKRIEERMRWHGWA